jgi:hypothetical protein
MIFSATGNNKKIQIINMKVNGHRNQLAESVNTVSIIKKKGEIKQNQHRRIK